MRVLHAAAEIYPLLKTGGLADVVGALPAVLKDQGADVRLILPGMPAITSGVLDLEAVAATGPAFGAAQLRLRLGRMPDSDLQAYVLDAPWLFDRPGNPYLGPNGQEWQDNPQRFAAFGWAAAHLAYGDLDPGWQADILHCHDWHTGLAPAYLRANPAARVKTVFTIHNLAYQGHFPLEVFRALQLPANVLNADGLEFHGQGNFMKSGLVFSDVLTTVSPRYAQEIRTPEFGAGHDGLLSARGDKLSGILNGVDYEVWNSGTDRLLPANYSAQSLQAKAVCKAALQAAAGLETNLEAPLFAAVTRLTDQKGTDLILAVLPALLRMGGQLIVLGTGERYLQDALAAAAQAHPRSVHAQFSYDEEMAHRMVAAADVILVPSRFEPCGLTQMYGLRYGTVPLVRRVGGLADTVIDADTVPVEGTTEAGGTVAAETVATGTGTAGTVTTGTVATGFVFDRATPQALEAAIARAVSAYADKDRWRQLMLNGMAQDYSWAASAARYRDLYDALLAPSGQKTV